MVEAKLNVRIKKRSICKQEEQEQKVKKGGKRE